LSIAGCPLTEEVNNMTAMHKNEDTNEGIPIIQEENGSFAAAFSDKAIRRGFIRSV